VSLDFLCELDEGLTTVVVELIELVGEIVICGPKEETGIRRPKLGVL